MESNYTNPPKCCAPKSLLIFPLIQVLFQSQILLQKHNQVLFHLSPMTKTWILVTLWTSHYESLSMSISHWIIQWLRLETISTIIWYNCPLPPILPTKPCCYAKCFFVEAATFSTILSNVANVILGFKDIELVQMFNSKCLSECMSVKDSSLRKISLVYQVSQMTELLEITYTKASIKIL